MHSHLSVDSGSRGYIINLHLGQRVSSRSEGIVHRAVYECEWTGTARSLNEELGRKYLYEKQLNIAKVFWKEWSDDWLWQCVLNLI